MTNQTKTTKYKITINELLNLPSDYNKFNIHKDVMHKKIIILVTVLTALAIYQLYVGQPDVMVIDEQLNIDSLDINFHDLFKQWRKQYNKRYHSLHEKKYRLKVFMENCRKIYQHNRDKDFRGYSFTLGLNQFADWTKDEYLSLLNIDAHLPQMKMTMRRSEMLNITLKCTGTIIESPNPPDEIDWTKKAVTPVLNQGKCGSSYAMSAVGAVQGLYALKMNKLQQFSVQQVLDCSENYGNQGCFGGFMDQAFWYIIDNGLATSKSYPLRDDTTKQSCKYTKTMKATSFTKCADVPSGNYTKLLSAVIQQPVSVAIDASGMQLYNDGIFDGQCSNSYINQAMVVVGYGMEDNQTYWKIKSSYGTTWGRDGYLYLEREQKDGPGKCGIQLVGALPQSLA